MSNLERIIKPQDLEINKYYYYQVKGNNQFFEGKYTDRGCIDGKSIGRKYTKIYTFYTKCIGKTKETILSDLNLRSIDSSCLEHGIRYYFHDNILDYDKNNNVIIREGIIAKEQICYHNPYCPTTYKDNYFMYEGNMPLYNNQNNIINPSNMFFYTKNYTPKNKLELNKELQISLKKREVFSFLPPL